jgi:fatty acyl-CoA reductase
MGMHACVILSPIIIATALFSSTVISSLNDPFPGWIENFNGPVGLMIGTGKGIVRVIFGSSNAIMDYMPVDVAVKNMCVAAWEKARSG